MDNLWQIRFDESSAISADAIPTLCCVGNGRIGIRGAIPELDAPGRQGIFLAGYYDQLPRPELDPDDFNPFLVSWSHLELVRGYHKEVCIVNCPNFLDGGWSVEDTPLTAKSCTQTGCVQTLNMGGGEYSVILNLRTPQGWEFTLRCHRFAHMGAENRVYTKYELTSHQYTGEICYTARIDDETTNFDISGIYQDTHDLSEGKYYRLYDPEKYSVGPQGIRLLIRGRVDGHKAAFATCLVGAHVSADPEAGTQVFRTKIRAGETVTLERISTFEADLFSEDVESRAAAELAEAMRYSYDQAKAESDKIWQKLWAKSDIRLEGDDHTQLGLRHSIYQLLIAACRSSDNVSIPAKGLTGEGYRGMVFWDTDVHMAPFYLYTQPEIARNLVKFRINTLAGAQEKAARYGQRGASFPWETSSSGREECECFLKLLTHQLHITADVVYTAGRYLHTTGDEELFRNGGAELLLETARFWLSKGFERDGQWYIPNASGPDELHLECDNNAYVNNLAAHNLELAWQAVCVLREKMPEDWAALKARLELTEEELDLLEKWHGRVKTMQGPDGLFEQCEGFFGLEDRIVFEDSLYDIPADTQTVKQADLLMLLFLLPDLVTPETLRVNWDYYEPRTTHTSSLSYGVHGILATRLGLKEKAKYYLDKSLDIDLYDEKGGCWDGAHLAAAGMSWSAVVSGMCGCELNRDILSVSPELPEGWNRVRFTLTWKGCIVELDIRQDGVSILLREGEELLVLLMGEQILLHRGETVCKTY